ncbi:MAG: YebC/PmpR family DNA-binding transcriptional regulator [Phycisphaerales bacterium]|nr:YebC/PmpR family DNA-binding transcriptional regulator [Phycisphaerales bacterium]
MAGHSTWKNIKHRKAAVDKKRGKVWTKIAKAIIVAAKHGGPDPASNLTLRYAIDEARYANMPRDTIERSIKKGAGEKEGDAYETMRYEGYGPGGVAIIIDCLTDNRTRTAMFIRDAMSKYGGNLGSIGCVAYLFDHRGQILIKAAGLTEDRVMEAAIEAGAQDVESPADPEEDGATFTVYTDIPTFQTVKEKLEAARFPIEEAQLAMVPQTQTTVRGEPAKDNMALIEVLEEIDDVQKVYTNLDVPEDELK